MSYVARSASWAAVSAVSGLLMACPLQVRVVLGSGMKKPLAWRGGRVVGPLGVRTRSARLSKKELLLHGDIILAPMAADLSRYDDCLRPAERAEAVLGHLTNCGVIGGFHHSPL